MPPSKILFLSSLSFTIGIFSASFMENTGKYLPVFSILGFSLAFSFLRLRNLIIPVALFMVFFGVGSAWFLFFSGKGSEFENISFFKGVVSEEPEIRERSAHFILSGIGEFKGEKVLLITERYAGHNYGDILEIKGKIREPEAFDGFDYPGYLAKDGVYLTTFNPKVEIIGHENLFRRGMLNFKKKAGEYLDRGLPRPHASIMAAMLLGDKRSIPQFWRDVMSDAGVGHLAAVSGLHVTVVTALLASLAESLGMSKKRAILITVPAVIFFIVMTGLQASAIRAGIMGGCLAFSVFFGRMNSSLRTAIIAAALMLFANPLLLKHDIGFQLSFMAVIGIIRFSPLLEKKLLFLPRIAQEATAMSLSAHIFTFPILVHHFGKISLVFPITNTLIVPILYIIMVLGAVFIFLSFISGSLALIALLPLWILTSYLVGIVHFFSGFSWSVITIGSISPIILSIFYIPLLLSEKSGISSLEEKREMI